MLYFRLRFLLLALCFIIAATLHYMLGFVIALPAYAASCILLISFIILGTVGPAFSRLRKGKILEARQLLGMTHFPNLLLRRHKAYYHFSYGMIDLQQKKLDRSIFHLEKAITLGLRNKNDHALAALNLAHIHFVQKNHQLSGEWAQRAKGYAPDDLMIQEKLAELEAALTKG